MQHLGPGLFRAQHLPSARAGLMAVLIGAAFASAGYAVAAETATDAATKAHSEPAITIKTDGAAAKGAVAAVERFEHALSDGDRNAALALLAPDLVVYESGHAERTREEYAASHLDADIAFLKTAKTRLVSRDASAVGDSALVLSETEIRSEREGRTTTRISLETLLLRRTDYGWRIAHIHWSSRVK